MSSAQNDAKKELHILVYPEIKKYDRQTVQQLCKKAKYGNNFNENQELGMCYAIGQGIEQDYKRAAELFRDSCSGADGRVSQYNLGVCYIHGYGVEQDNSTALSLFNLAAQSGMAEAQYALGLCYEYGIGITDMSEIDPGIMKSVYMQKAAKFYRMAAEQGFAKAQFRLSKCYALGDGVGRDDEQWHHWLAKAAAQGLPAAVDLLERLRTGNY